MKGSYKMNVDRVKKSTSKYFGISKDFNRDVKIQSGKLRDLCLLTITLNFLNFVFDSFRNRILFDAFQLRSHLKIM
jgi:hypothetical protein